MITAIDTNVLLDVLLDDPEFGESSACMLKKCLKDGRVVACDIVWAETASNFKSEKDFKGVMETLGLEFSPMSEESAFLSAALWRSYRSRGGKRDKIIADFLIGAHARKQAQRLLSRDRGFYRDFFSGLAVLNPADYAG